MVTLLRLSAAALVGVVVPTTPAPAATLFSAPQVITDGAAPYRLARNPNRTLAFDSASRLHLVYWSGAFLETSIAEPSYVYHREWTAGAGWSPQVSIDDSTIDSGSGPQHVGGRHPSLALTPDDTVWVVWHDHRHTNEAGNNINNLEIYADRKPAGGSFLAGDIRISTTTNTSIAGDNGYAARVAALPDGTIAVVWYDFTRGLGNNADIYVRHSDTTGNFVGTPAMEDLRLTDAAAQGALFAYSIPDVTVDAAGKLLAVWTAGFGGAAPVYFAAIPQPPAPVTVETLRTQTAGYDDAAKIVTAPNGDVWIVFTDRTGGGHDVRALRRPASSTAFEGPIAFAASPTHIERHGALAVADDGAVHLAWVDERDGVHVYHARFAPGTWALEEETRLTTESGLYVRPALALDGDGRPHVVFEEEIGSGVGAIHHVRAVETASARGWELYQ
ncbi:MAG: hypothetical protein KF858_10855 [Candidatus Sumerlaeia bacterium]|nr:hypothetical protein [Candidatus Sumerlaeia bacterium]